MLNLPAFLSLLGIHAGFLDRKILMITDQREEVSQPIEETDLLLWAPITLAFVYIGTTLKDLSDVTHGWSEFSTTRCGF
ncbi:hypothetical protein NC652_024399 [Populus alba x Populus x berolinensis]|nr:hypothetical protein NC652_024399 [Populus alba x Populus x berolinensis]